MSKIDAVLNPLVINQGWIEEAAELYPQNGGLSNAFRVAASGGGWSPITATYISDNGADADAAIGEIRINIADIHRRIFVLSGRNPFNPVYLDVPAQDWRAAAFDLAQFSRYRLDGPGNVFFVNCAPRLEQRGKEIGSNKGENVYVAMLPNGAVVSGVSPHSFAFFRDLVESKDLEIFPVAVQTEGSQFRSRDFFPHFYALLAFNLGQNADNWNEGLSVEARRKVLSHLKFVDTNNPLALSAIPDLSQEIVVARVDTHGNLKLSATLSDVSESWVGAPVSVLINRKAFLAQLRPNMFDNNTSLAGIAPGSSGDWKDSKKKRPGFLTENWDSVSGAKFLEIAFMGRSAKDVLGLSNQQLKEGVIVTIEPGTELYNRSPKHHIGGASHVPV